VVASLPLDSFGSEFPTVTEPEQPTSSTPAATAERLQVAADKRAMVMVGLHSG
jgi:hypothetical protein